MPQLRRVADAAPRRRRAAADLPPLRSHGEPAACLPGLRLDRGRAPRRRHAAPRGRAARGARAAAGVPAGCRRRPAQGRHRVHPGPLRLGACRHPRGHPDGRSGARLPGRGAGRRPGRRRQPAVPRLPGRGAHLLAGRPAGRPQRSRAGGRAGAGPDAVPVGPQPAPCGLARCRRLPRGGGGAPARAALSAVLHLDQSAGGGSRPARLPTPRRSCWRAATLAAASTCSAPRRCSASRTCAAPRW